ncbi:hypothetical protein D3C77_465890 [compost metagenome]
MVGEVTGRLAGNGRPCRASVRASVYAFIFIRNANINRLCSLSRRTGRRIERNPGEPHDVALILIIGVFDICARVRKAAYLAPCRPIVGAFP